MQKDDSRRLGRRAAIRTGLTVLASVPVASALGCGGGELTCAPGSLTEAERTMRTTLNYVDHGSNPSRHCSGCALYTGNANSCGTCSVIAGEIHPQGTCDSFAARS
jgi:hypothetical protein